MQGMDYNVDIVMCIDATVSMRDAIEMTKETALTFHEQLAEAMSASMRDIGKLRIKVIVFRDYGCDAEPMVESKFFVLPDENVEYKAFVDGIKVSGGGDLPENSLEAISLALKSDWTTEGSKRRHIILVFTDNEALKLGERADSPNYPEGMPADLAELGAWWEKTDQNFISNYEPDAGRLVVFAPRMYPWNEEGIEVWNRVTLTATAPGAGMKDVVFEEILDRLVSSIVKKI